MGVTVSRIARFIGIAGAPLDRLTELFPGFYRLLRPCRPFSEEAGPFFQPSSVSRAALGDSPAPDGLPTDSLLESALHLSIERIQPIQRERLAGGETLPCACVGAVVQHHAVLERKSPLRIERGRGVD